ncbi:MAG: NAD(P)-binding protein [Actinomycetaceae bacterium]|nr:NAD(P)-binding protein [Actinomycetaceae bacterium]
MTEHAESATTSHTAHAATTTPNDSYDAIVIGSGIGGLTAAGLLARMQNKRVLVVEKHSEPGGLTHVFRRDGAEWDTGVHYIGDLDEGSSMRAYFDYLSGGNMQWRRLPDSDDRFILPNLDTTMPSAGGELEELLTRLFPAETAGIRSYMKAQRRAAQWADLYFAQPMLPAAAAPFIRLAQLPYERLAMSRTIDVINKHVRAPELRALLGAQWGDYGIPPSRSAFATHAMIAQHYTKGAWYPDGGSSRIARTFEEGIEASGGAVRVCQEVQRIIVEGGRATGIEVLDRRGAKARLRIYRAPLIISAIGVPETYQHLLPEDGEVGALTRGERKRIARIDGSFSGVSLHIRLNKDPRSFGLNGGNLCIYRDVDHEVTANSAEDLLSGYCHNATVSFRSLKAGTSVHTVDVLTLVNTRAFDRWKGSPVGARGEEYTQLKERIAAGMLELVESVVPGFSAAIEFMDISTPLTYEHYTGHKNGEFYGMAASLQRIKAGHFGPKTPISGLYLAGQDVVSTGIGGALMGGVAAVSAFLGSRGFPQIQEAIKKELTSASGTLSPSPTWPLPEGKYWAQLMRKRRVTADIWDIEVEIDGDIEQWTPGQYARLEVARFIWRDYSIVGIQDRRVRFLISTRTRGYGSHFVESAPIGQRLRIELPLGSFSARTNEQRHRLFLATGTGLAPFIPIFAHGIRKTDLLFFGAKTRNEDLTTLIGDPLPETLHCISREKVDGLGFHYGRVTSALTKAELDWANTEAYVCGSATMVADTVATLERLGAAHIHTEPY